MAVSASAADLRVSVTDSGGQPLRYAAITATWPGAEPPQAAAELPVMTQRDLAFVPHMLVVPQHASVLFPNRDKTRHHVYSFSKAKTFDIKLYIGRPERPITFNQPGVVTIGCNIHDHMQGYIIVSADPRWAVTDANGEAIFENMPAVPLTLSLWHPWMMSEATRATREVAADTRRVRFVLDVTAPPQPVKDPGASSLQDQFDRLSQ